MKPNYLLITLLIALGGCSSIPIEPADDQWERSEEKISGIKTGDSGWYTLFSDKDTKQSSSQTHSASTKPSDFHEFRDWQQWQIHRQENSADYIEFRQWLEFQSLKNQK